MALSQDLVSQFAKLTKNEKQPDNGTLLKGTYKKIDGEEYVKIDGSDIWTPVKSTVDAETGERVTVLIKDHTATVNGNISSPSARTKSLDDLKDEVDEYGNTIQQLDNTIQQQGNSIIQINNNLNQANNTINQHSNTINQQGNAIQQINNTIVEQGNTIDSMNNTITQHGDSIDSMNNTITQHGNSINQMNNTIQQQGNIISQQGNTIQQQGNTITEFGSDITILNSAFVISQGRITGLSQAVVDELVTNSLNSRYANIDFSNIQIAAIASLFSDSGIIEDLIVSQGKITGELVGVTIKGDLIEANTIAADKLVVRGDDGLYYKLNIDGLNNISTQEASKFILLETEPDNWETNYTDYYIIDNNKYIHVTGETTPNWSSNTYYKLSSTYESALDGSNIVAQSITADKIQVTDLVAFGATIGGFNITNTAIHSPGKTSAESTVRGVYLDRTGQFSIGDDENYLKYYKDENEEWQFDIRANSIKMGTSNKTIKEEMDEIREETTTLLQIESSRGTVFKNDQVSTVLSIAIYRGSDRITDMTTLREKMGNNVYLQWKWKRLNDDDYGVISASDPRLSNDGFRFTLSPQDVDTKVTFLCELIN